MLQLIQPIDGRRAAVVEVPAPRCGPGQVLIANRASLISAGTEKSTADLARQSLLMKARQRPDHVRRVLEKFRQEGLASTLEQVRARLAQPMPMGYSSAGEVIDVGEGVREFRVGDRVASNGPHAGVVAVGKNLVARIPDEVPYEHAAYAVVGAVGLQGVRLANVGVGDVVVVIGLGLIGQITVSLLKAAGCRVIGTDVDVRTFELARAMGADAVGLAEAIPEYLSRLPTGGADAVLVTASTRSNAPLELAAELSRDRGKVVAVGAVGLNVPRRPFYAKELELVVSRSYGPGRYDAGYEEAGHDYPIGYVRWTEQRNISAVLDQMAAGRLNVDRLTTHRFSMASAGDAYELMEQAREPFLGIVLCYAEEPVVRRVALPTTSRPRWPAGRGASVIGTGSFAASTLIPAIVRSRRFEPRGLVSAKGLSSRTLAERHGFSLAATDLSTVLDDEETLAVFLATRHHQHVRQGLEVLHAGKHLFIEKPLAISEDQLDEWIERVSGWGDGGPIWMVGFNRRFAPATRLLKETLQRTDDVKAISIRMNVGAISSDHWVHDPEVGGGRIVGEACHAIDLATYLVGSLPVRVYAEAISPRNSGLGLEDNVALQLRFADGSSASILYTSGGDRSSGKERVEVFAGGMSGLIDDFRRVEVRRAGRVLKRRRWWSQQKGYAEEIAAFADGIAAGQFPIDPAEMIAVTQASLRAVQSLRMETPLEVGGT